MKTFIAALALVCLAATVSAASVSDLQARHARGQTFVTFTKHAGATSASKWDVYRGACPMTALVSGQKVATVDADSWHLRYDDSWPPDNLPKLSNGFVVEDDGAQLTNTQGLLVWTTAFSGDYCYGVAVQGDPAFVATGPISETHQDVHGWVRLKPAFIPSGTGVWTYKYFRWEDVTNWRTADFSYYGHRVNVFKPNDGAASYPLLLALHSAGFGYGQAGDALGAPARGVIVMPRDNGFDWNQDPYAPGVYGHSAWFGRVDTGTGRLVPITERRVTDYVKLVRDDPDFKIDPARVYVYGSSLGAGAMHMASHYPTLFAAADVSIGFIDASAWSGAGLIAPTGAVDVPGLPTWGHYEDLAALAADGIDLPPISHTFNKDDAYVNTAHYPAALTAFETNHVAFCAEWRPGNHAGFTIAGTNCDLLRWRKNEAYPAFGNASTSDPVSAPSTGQRNARLDFGSSLHPVGAAIVDTSTDFGITLKSLTVDATADVTPRNTQAFHPQAGSQVSWLAGSAGGLVTVAPNGLVTVPAVPIPAAGVRLTLTASAGSPPPALTLSCPASIAQQAAGPIPVSYPAPTPGGGLAPVSVSCDVTSGSTFPIGPTAIACSATDAAVQQASCGFTVTLTLAPPPPPPPNTAHIVVTVGGVTYAGDVPAQP